MKRIGKQLTLICLLILALCVSARAAESNFDRLDFIPRQGFTTEIVDVYGTVHTYNGVLKVTSLEEHDCAGEIASYAILFQGEELLTSQLHDIHAVPEGQNAGSAQPANGYYSVTFYIDDGSKEVFMTGLTPENQQKVQNANIAAVLNGTEVSLGDLAFIDAEKQYDIMDEFDQFLDSDQELCWAAASSNILHYTGWGKQAGFGSADYLLDQFAACFTDGGSRTEYGLEWFFNGYSPAEFIAGWPKVNAVGRFAYGEFAGFFPEYCTQDVIELVDVAGMPWNIDRVMVALREGCGVAIGLGQHYDNGYRAGGHAVTLWGYVKDRDSDPVTDKSAYCALIIADSDNDVTWGSNRRGAPNTLQVEPLEPVSLADMDTWCLSDYHNRNWYLENFTILKSYSADIPIDNGTKNVFDQPDIALTMMETGISGMLSDAFAKDQAIEFLPYLTVRGDVAYSGPLTLTLTLANSSDEIVWNDIFDISDVYAAGSDRYFALDFDAATLLTPGTYTVTAEISDMTEDSYLNNNSASATFTVNDLRSDDDTLELSSAVIEKKNGSGLSGILTLEYSGELQFVPQQYYVSISYDAGHEEWEDVYVGKERPETITIPNLVPGMVGNTRVRLFVQGLGDSGYSGYLPEYEASVEDYYALQVESEIHELKIYQGGTSFLDGCELKFDVLDCGSIPLEKKYRMHLVAFTEEEGEVILLDDFFTPSRSGAPYAFSELEDMAALPAGEYYLYADLYYEPILDHYYQSYTLGWLGTLTVLPNDYSLRCGEPEVGAVEVQIPYTMQIPNSNAYRLIVYYHTDREIFALEDWRNYCGWYRYDFDNYEGEQSSWFVMPVEPDTTYYYHMAIVQDEAEKALTEEIGTFTTEICKTIGAEEELTFALESGEKDAYALTAPADGIYTVSVKGPMGSLSVRYAEAFDQNEISFHGMPESVQVDLAKGQKVYLEVTAEMGGSFNLSTKAAGIGIETLLHPEGSAMEMKSGDSAYFRTYRAMEKSGTVTVTVSGADGYIRYYDRAQGRMVDLPFTLDGVSVMLPVTPDTPASFRIYAHQGGAYTVSYSSDVTLCEKTSEGVRLLATEDSNAKVLVAACYSGDGRLLRTYTAKAGDSLLLQEKAGAELVFFRLDDEYCPVAEVETVTLK